MTIYKNLKGLRVVNAHGFVCGYANDPDRPSLDNHIFLMFNVLPENGLFDKQFEIQYGDAFVTTYIKNKNKKNLLFQSRFCSTLFMTENSWKYHLYN